MEGNLHDTPLSSMLELIHLTRQSGQVEISAEVPLWLSVVQGEIVDGGILDWRGVEAIQSYDLHQQTGSFRFTPSSDASSAGPQLPFSQLMTEWARVNDEWARIRELVDSPSRVLEHIGAATNPAHPFQGGKSIRAIAHASGVSAFEVASAAMPQLRSGELRLLPKYAWLGLRMRHPEAKDNHFQAQTHSALEVPKMLNGKRNFAELLELGFSIHTLRHYLRAVILNAEVKVPGNGWLLRDLSWEIEVEGSR